MYFNVPKFDDFDLLGLREHIVILTAGVIVEPRIVPEEVMSL